MRFCFLCGGSHIDFFQGGCSVYFCVAGFFSCSFFFVWRSVSAPFLLFFSRGCSYFFFLVAGGFPTEFFCGDLSVPAHFSFLIGGSVYLFSGIPTKDLFGKGFGAESFL